MIKANQYRTVSCGELREENIGQQVRVAGWVENIRDHGGVMFLDIRDQYGVLLTNFIIRTVEVDNVMFGRDIFPLSFLCSAGLTLLFSLLVNLAMSFKIRRVNMVESLKSVE